MKRLLFFILMLGSVAVQAQSFGDTLFHSICTEIERLDRYWQARQKLPPFEIRVGPVSGDEWIQFEDKSGKQIVGGKEDKELYKVAYSFLLPVFPLKDTLCIVDTTGILCGRQIDVNGKQFYIHRCLVTTCKHTAKGTMFVQPILICGDDLYFRFSFTGYTDLFFCEFRMRDGVFQLRRSYMQEPFIRTDKYPRIE